MKDLREVLCRIGISELSEFLGQQSVSILEKLDYKSVTTARLAKSIIDEFGSAYVLLDKKKRNKLFLALKANEIEDLRRCLGIQNSKNSIIDLCRLSFPYSSILTKKLFEYFDCELPRLEKAKKDSPIRVAECNYPLFEHQRNAFVELIDKFSGRSMKVLLHMPTGSGKTRTAMNLVSKSLRESVGDRDIIVWLAYSEELCDQAVDEFIKSWSFLGNRKVNVFRFYGSYEIDLKIIKNGVLFAGLGKLYSRSLKVPSEFIPMSRRANLVVMDEAHQATAPTYQHLLNLFSLDDEIKVLGLSATPGRSLLNIGEDIKLARFFNRQKVTLEVKGYKSPLDFLFEEGYLAVPEFVTVDYNAESGLTKEDISKISSDLDIPLEILKKLAADEKRNILILANIIAEARLGKKILVFACSVSHARLIAELLNYKGFKAASISSETDENRRSFLIKAFRESKDLNILTNYGVLTTGFDAPCANTAIIARPTRSVVLYSQMIGRVARGIKVGGNKKCKIITINDKALGIKDMSKAFRFWDDIW
jgi:superfamily II DNA or RNA helicase